MAEGLFGGVVRSATLVYTIRRFEVLSNAYAQAGCSNVGLSCDEIVLQVQRVSAMLCRPLRGVARGGYVHGTRNNGRGQRAVW